VPALPGGAGIGRPYSTIGHANLGEERTFEGFLIVEADVPRAPAHIVTCSVGLEIIVRSDNEHAGTMTERARMALGTGEGRQSRRTLITLHRHVAIAFWPTHACEGWKNVRVWIEHA
jgi:hypothetical protein